MRLGAETVRAVVARALEEDLGVVGDVTGQVTFREPCAATARLVAREALVVAGLEVAHEAFRQCDEEVSFSVRQADGDRVATDTVLAVVSGDARGLLAAERTALNFMMRMSGVAGAARRAVEEVEGTGVVILDTRKTMPGLRLLDKYAVAVGGATNHRMGLYDAVMLKDTHLARARSIDHAVRAALDAGHAPASVTVEVRDLEQLEQAIEAGAGRVMLDNMDPTTMRQAVERAAGRVVLEASGGLRPGRLREVAETGVDCLSLGWLTHSAPAADIAMEMDAS